MELTTEFTPNEFLKVGSQTVTEFSDGSASGNIPIISIDPARNRKHIVPDWSSISPELGIQYKVSIVGDTRPGELKGVFHAEVIGPTEFGERQLEMKGFGYKYETSYTKGAVSEQEIQDNLFPGKDIVFTDFGKQSDGKLDHQTIGVWIKEESFPEGSQTEPPEEVEDTPLPEIPITNIPPVDRIGDGKTIRFLDIIVEAQNSEGKLVPPKEQFAHFTLDERTATIVYKVASAYGRRSPLLLEGDTDTSKTSSVEYFASRIGAEVVRVNLSGQTDVTELIGKFVPNDESQRLKFDSLVSGYSSSNLEEREKAYKRVDSKSADTLKKAHDEGRALTVEESNDIAHAHGLNISKSGWVWQNGKAVDAAIKGQILLLDELFMAEPQVVERLNSLLEDPPSLVLSENGGIKIGLGGDYAVSDKFWMVGTTNAGGMTGRTQHSEAFKRRWRDYVEIDSPTETDYQHMLNFLVLGQQPEFQFNGLKYQAQSSEPVFGKLGEKDKNELANFLVNMSKFHAEMRSQSHPESGIATIGKDQHKKGGKYTFTRATLISVMQYIKKEKLLDVEATVRSGEPVYMMEFGKKVVKGVERFYLDPVYSEDRAAIKAAWNKYWSPIAYSSFQLQ